MNKQPQEQYLPVSAPAAQGVDAEAVDRFVGALQAAPGVEPHSLMVLRHGHVVAAGWWWPYTPGRLQLLYSLSKSFTSTAAGLAVGEGLVRLDDPVISYFPEFDGEVTDARSRRMLVRHIASMASGHSEDTWQKVVAEGGDPVLAFLRLPPDREPGTVFAYNQSATYTLGTIVQRVTGRPLTEYLRPRLFDPLGVGEVRWEKDSLGREVGFSQMYATTDAVARLGQLYLQGGRWQDRQLLSRQWVAEATRVHISNAPTAAGAAGGPDSGGARPDWEQGYGYQFWMSRHGYRGDGACGQYCLVLPEQDAVVAMTGQVREMQVVLNLVWELLLPAFTAAPGTPSDADDALARRLERLSVPIFPAHPAPPGPAEAWDGATFRPTGGPADQQPSLLKVGLSAYQGGWQVSLGERAWAFRAPLSTTAWAVAGPAAPCEQDGDDLPAAVQGGWLEDGSLRFDVLFLETPHRLVVKCRLPEGDFDARWVTAPLRAWSLRSLRSPL